jgi:hypothetical protein
MWTFESEPFKVSKKRFETVEDAAKAACDWLIVCAENEFFPTVRLAQTKDPKQAV